MELELQKPTAKRGKAPVPIHHGGQSPATCGTTAAIDIDRPLDIVYEKNEAADQARCSATDSAGKSVHMPTSLINIGFREAEALPATYMRRPYKRPYPADLVPKRPNSYFRDHRAHPGSAGLNLEYCEYDMDEQDAGILGVLMAQHRGCLTAELFEIVMSMLDAEAFLLELGRSADKLRIDETRPCCVCNDLDCDNANVILFCDGCDIAVHQDCYGVAHIPEGQWLCRRCEAERLGYHPRCAFCPFVSGALKQTENKSRWGHIICAQWIPELTFGDLQKLEPIVGVSRIPQDRYRLKCYLCEERVGACIQCSQRSCTVAYHATCAQVVGLPMQLATGESFCHRHSREINAPDNLDIARLALASERAAEARDKEASKVYYSRWQTPGKTPLVPLLIRQAIKDAIQTRFGVDISPALSQICRYWTLKRDGQGVLFGQRLRAAIERQDDDASEQALGKLKKLRQLLIEVAAVIDRDENTDVPIVEDLIESAQQQQHSAAVLDGERKVTKRRKSLSFKRIEFQGTESTSTNVSHFGSVKKRLRPSSTKDELNYLDGKHTSKIAVRPEIADFPMIPRLPQKRGICAQEKENDMNRLEAACREAQDVGVISVSSSDKCAQHLRRSQRLRSRPISR